MQLIRPTASGAVFDSSRKYRYSLWRRWCWVNGRTEEDLFRHTIAFVGLNPSTADEREPDPTITRCINYSKKFGFETFVMLNCFAYRATLPVDMKRQENPIGVEQGGADNDEAIKYFADRCPVIVAAWGNDGQYLNRSKRVMEILKSGSCEVKCLAKTQAGEPGHPLYLKSCLELRPI